ncbi:MAG: nuclear transport factor 2 family protein [Myxococcales bacterium]|nr:nuclear transport factor 2 family protein [Myxococcales bacterium]MCB9536968.1 nuclear transport factor 2 family protein [Myxococcales bacterium]
MRYLIGVLCVLGLAAPALGVAKDEAAARATLDAWLKAQNEGDFAAYSALYAQKFNGVKRAGARTSRFQRDGWLADRGKMFKGRFTVAAANVKVLPQPNGAVVSFEQTWASKRFKDVGPKQLVLVKEGDALRIAREEMLASTIVGGEHGGPPPSERLSLAMVLDHPYVVLATEAGEDAVEGPVHDLGNHTTRRAVRAGGPGSAWIGRAVELYAGGRKACVGKVADVHVVSRVTPHFGAVQTWQEDGLTPQQQAEAAWEMAGDGRLLVARVDAKADDCKGARWARAADAPAPTTLQAMATVPGWLATAAVAQTRALPGYAAIQKGWKAEARDAKGERWELHGGATPQVQAFAADGKPTVVLVTMRAGYGCGDFFGSFWAAYTVEGKTLTRISDPDNPTEFDFVSDDAFVAVVDADGDGRWEVVRKEGLHRQDAKGVLREVLRLPYPYYDCPC